MFIKYCLKKFQNLHKQLTQTILFKYLASGVLIALIYYFFLSLLVKANVNYSISILSAYFSSAFVRYMLHYLWVYSEKKPELKSSSKRYIVLLCSSYLLNNLFVEILLLLGLKHEFVIILSTLFVSIYGIVLSTLWVFITKNK